MLLGNHENKTKVVIALPILTAGLQKRTVSGHRKPHVHHLEFHNGNKTVYKYTF